VSLVDELESVWSRVATRPVLLSRRWLRQARLSRLVNTEVLPQTQIQSLGSPRRINDCAECLDTCCVGKKSTVLLHLRDIACLLEDKKTSLITQEKPTFSREEKRLSPALDRHVSSVAWQVFPILRQNSFYACSALSDEGRCTLYPRWPLSCERFPVALNLDAEAVFLSKRCGSTRVIETDAEDERLQEMEVGALAAYNERIKDFMLLTHARDALRNLGITKYLNLNAWPLR